MNSPTENKDLLHTFSHCNSQNLNRPVVSCKFEVSGSLDVGMLKHMDTIAALVVYACLCDSEEREEECDAL